ncbi:hypothetical protein A2U01_0045111, partial [Trifolium medium]|nr:hypothetical protein [Trifolium medium]
MLSPTKALIKQAKRKRGETTEKPGNGESHGTKRNFPKENGDNPPDIEFAQTHKFCE